MDAQDLFQALYRFVENTHTHALIYIPSVFLHLKPFCQTLPPLKKEKNRLLGFIRRVCDGGDGEGVRLVGSDVKRHLCHCP